MLAGRISKWITLGAWLIIATVVFPLASKLTSATDNNSSSFLPHSAEATAALNRAEHYFPTSSDLVAVVVYARDSGLTPADTAKVNADIEVFRQYADGGQVSPPIPDGKNTALLVSFPITGDSDAQVTAATKISDQAHRGAAPGLQTALTGSAGAVKDITDVFSGIDTTLLFVTAGVVALILLITYRSPILWLVPLISVGIASQLASGLAYLLAHHGVITVNGQSQGILTVLVFGAGTDYALLLIARYREELRRHESRHPRLRCDRRDQSALPARRSAQQHPRPWTGRRDRHRQRAGRDDHAAPGHPGDLRPVVVLAVHASLQPGCGGPRHRRGARRLEPHCRLHRVPAAHDLAHHRTHSGRTRLRHARAARRSDQCGPIHEEGRLGHRAADRQRALPGGFLRAGRHRGAGRAGRRRGHGREGGARGELGASTDHFSRPPMGTHRSRALLVTGHEGGAEHGGGAS
jgi:hypothetical protein